MDQGDLISALPWFVEALRFDRGDRSRERTHRVRIAATLAQCPRLLQMWFHAGSVNSAVFSRDGRWVLTASDNRKKRWDSKGLNPVVVIKYFGSRVTAAWR